MLINVENAIEFSIGDNSMGGIARNSGQFPRVSFPESKPRCIFERGSRVISPSAPTITIVSRRWVHVLPGRRGNHNGRAA